MVLLSIVDATTITAVVAVATLSAGSVAAFLRLKGATREVIETAADKRVENSEKRVADAQQMAAHFREAYEATLVEAKEERELKHQAQNEAAALKLATDLTALRKDLNGQFDSIAKRFDKVEETQRETVTVLRDLDASQKAHIAVLEAIVARMGMAA